MMGHMKPIYVRYLEKGKAHADDTMSFLEIFHKVIQHTFHHCRDFSDTGRC